MPLQESIKSLIFVRSGIYLAACSFHDKLNHAIKDERHARFDRNLIDVVAVHELLQQCAKRRSLLVGKGCHSLAIHLGLVTDTITCNILINFYTKCGRNDCARHVFDAMPVRSIVSWNTMISGYTRNGDDVQALKLFSMMHQEGTRMSEFTLSSTLCACAAKYAITECTQLHAIAVKLALDSNSFVGTAVLDVYAKCNMIKDARIVFEKMSEKTAVTWSSLIAGLVQNGLHDEALHLFQSSQREGMELTEFTLSALLSTCASSTLIVEGKQLHAIIIKYGFHGNYFVTSSLVDVYSKCGQIEKAYAVFSDMEHKNVVLWNAMIASFTSHGHSWEVMILFEKMHQAGIFPNEVTYLSMLSVCSHAGFVEEARRYFSLLMSDKTVEPNVLHYSCMVDVLGRSGNIDEAWELIQQMPFEPTTSMWGSLLGSCRNYRHTGLARLAAEQLFKLEPENGGNHVLLSDVYAGSESWENAVLARKYLKDSGAKTDMGTSWELEKVYPEMREFACRTHT
ncbi:hypothetical protein EJB05_02329, partial [Eragrostis curvula]